MNTGELTKCWRTLTGTTLAMIGGVITLPHYMAGLFVKPLQNDFGWSRSALSYGPAILIAVIVITSPLVGLAADRIGARKLVALGMIAVSIGFAALSQMSGRIVQYYAIMAVMAAAGNLAGTCTITSVIAKTFQRCRGAALGIALGGVGLGAAVGGPIVATVLATYGWRTAYIAMSAFCLVAAPVAFKLLQRPEGAVAKRVNSEGPGYRQAIRTPLYWILTMNFLLIALASTGLIVHFVPLLTDEGMSARDASILASGAGVSVTAGRVITGLLLDRFSASKVASVIMLLGAFCYAIFFYGGTHFASFAAGAIGLTFGAETDLVGYMVSRYFGLREYGRMFGLMYALCTVGNSVSTVVYGWVRDAYGSYQPMIILAAMFLASSSLIFVFLPKYPNEKLGLVGSNCSQAASRYRV